MKQVVTCACGGPREVGKLCPLCDGYDEEDEKESPPRVEGAVNGYLVSLIVICVVLLTALIWITYT